MDLTKTNQAHGTNDASLQNNIIHSIISNSNSQKQVLIQEVLNFLSHSRILTLINYESIETRNCTDLQDLAAQVNILSDNEFFRLLNLEISLLNAFNIQSQRFFHDRPNSFPHLSKITYLLSHLPLTDEIVILQEMPNETVGRCCSQEQSLELF